MTDGSDPIARLWHGVRRACRSRAGRVARRLRFGKESLVDEVEATLHVGCRDGAERHARRYDHCVTVAAGLELDATTHSFDLDPWVPPAAQREEFARAVETVRERYRSGDRVLVHCHEGKERAPTVATTVLAEEHDLSWDEALARVKSARPLVDPTDHLECLARERLGE